MAGRQPAGGRPGSRPPHRPWRLASPCAAGRLTRGISRQTVGAWQAANVEVGEWGALSSRPPLVARSVSGSPMVMAAGALNRAIDRCSGAAGPEVPRRTDSAHDRVRLPVDRRTPDPGCPWRRLGRTARGHYPKRRKERAAWKSQVRPALGDREAHRSTWRGSGPRRDQAQGTDAATVHSHVRLLSTPPDCAERHAKRA